MKGLRFIVMTMFLPFSITISFAQKEANIWYFGNHAGLDFNSGSPISLTNGSLSSHYGSASRADANGNLLFYSDGETVWNKNHSVMLNGTGLISDYQSQKVIIVPKPNSSNIYYVFTSSISGLRYSEINMLLDNELGAVTTTKNLLVAPSTNQTMSVTLHCNGRDIWVVTHGMNNNEFYSVLVTPSGVNMTPVISYSDIPVSGDNTTVMKLSPNGKKLVMYLDDYGENPTKLYDFDNVTGIINNPLTLIPYLPFVFPIQMLGAEFSPSGNLLYISTDWVSQLLYQFNLEASDIINSKIVLYSGERFGQLQLGPDQKIYVARDGDSYLGTVNFPDVIGPSCGYVNDGVYVKANGVRMGLPQIIINSSTNSDFEIVAENTCLGDSVVFEIDNCINFDTYLWDFGDGSTSIDEVPLHTYVSAGDYVVTLTVSVGLETSTYSSLVTIYELPVVTPIVELQQCDDDQDGFSFFNLDEVIHEITANATNETISFFKTEADAISGINAITNITAYDNEMVSSDIVYARVENSNGCFRTSKVNLTVTTTQIPETFIREFHVCDDEMDGNTKDGISSFDFSSVNSEIEALFPLGQDLEIIFYRNQSDALAETDPITDISNYRNLGYPNFQQIYIRVDSRLDNDCIGLGAHINLFVEPLPVFTIETPQIVCSYDPTFTVVLDPLEADPTESFSYSWVLNGVEVSTAPTLTVSMPGTYLVTLSKTDGTGCSRSREIFVNASELATITINDITVMDNFDNNTISISTSNLGQGDYEFALDNSSGSYQDEPFFDHIASGKHTLYVRDKKGCGITELEVFIMGFPKFFTPNDDGYNDTWNIEGLSTEYSQKSTIYIFDRYGKLIKQLNPKGAGWNGLYNGEKLRPSDYWFVAELYKTNGSMITYRGHFSLVR